MITIEVDDNLLEKAEETLKYIPKGAQKALSAALNRTAAMSTTEMGRKVQEDYHIRAREVKETIKIRRASISTLEAVIRSTGRRKELFDFKVSPNSPRHANPPKAIRVEVQRGKSKPYEGGFVARGTSSGKLHVLKRVGKARYPVWIKYGPSIPQMIDDNDVIDHIEKFANEKLEERVEHEMDRILRGIGQ